MTELLLHKVLPGVTKLTLWISVGVLIGALLEAIGLVKRLAVLSKPIIRMAKLPPIAMSAFVTSFVSPKSGNGMLSAAFSNNEISRRGLVLSAAANSFPSTLMHLRVSGPLIISMLGYAGVGYIAFIITGAFTVLITILIISRFWHCDKAGSDEEPVRPLEECKFSEAWKRAWDRWKNLLPKVLLISIPLYTLVGWMNSAGHFKALAKMMPEALASTLPPEAMAILASQMTGSTRAAPVAREFLESGALSTTAVCITLIIGYALSLPVRVLRRNLPSALSIFPGKNGLLITVISQLPRFILAVCIIVTWIVINRGDI